MTTLVRGRVTAIWGVLVMATVVSWFLGTHGGHDRTAGHPISSVVIVLVAFIKVRLIGMYFMELRAAPLLLRTLYESYCLIVCGVVIGMYQWA
ncbi:cytochrome C oxidase subunit IV family protein [Nocardia sp. NPDC059239]|uniref:cytochrome C oxidase subunit IV family protein n=1 Tax=unclassified Nocardia TaxID=2637762 RepID=UPI00368709B9